MNKEQPCVQCNERPTAGRGDLCSVCRDAAAARAAMQEAVRHVMQRRAASKSDTLWASKGYSAIQAKEEVE